jgi:uncharacterized protein (TIGR02266 family)
LIDARRHPRLPSGLRCWCETDQVSLYARLANLGQEGVFLECRAAFPPGTRTRLRFAVDGGTLEIDAVVVWVRPEDAPGGPAGMGMRFAPLPDAALALLQRHLARREEATP